MTTRIRLSLLGLTALTLLPAAAREMTSSDFKRASVLASDKWVKIGIEESGVYEISYETLRAMGFPNPEKVGLYGHGGRVQKTDFLTVSGTRSNIDDLEPVGVFHKDGKMYFYGVGVEDISFISNSLYKPTNGYFNRNSRNIYSTHGYYFLTDREEPLVMDTFEPSPWAYYRPVSQGLGYVYHERDLQQNLTYSGQLFWGERFGTPYDQRLRWEVEMPGAIEEQKGVAQCDIYFENVQNISATVSYGFENASTWFSGPFRPSGSDYYLPFSTRLFSLPVPGEKGTFFVDFDLPYQLQYANLDYWLVTYLRNTPTMTSPDGSRLAQDYVLIPGLDNYTSGEITIPDPASLEAFCITDRYAPFHLQIDKSGSKGKLRFTRNGSNPEIVVFDTQRPQKQISGYETAFSEVANQNLHSLAETGADFVIITTPALREYAERLADIHRKAQGITVAVATTEECYNEFSAGVPDPMAYRSFVKMLHVSPLPPKNLLLLGPLYADFRGIGVEKDPLDGIIAYQNTSCSSARGAHNVNDFYGIMAESMRTDYIERNTVEVAVAILPIKFASEAEILIDKVEKYINRTDHAYYLNQITNIGGLGDDHLHDEQANEIQEWIHALDNEATILTPLSIDTYGNAEAQKKLFGKINQGLNWFTYFGHGAEQFLGKNRYFFAAGDVYKLHNDYLPMAGFGGCQITNTDRGLRGLGETIVTNTPYGCIGAVVSARETWSGQNLEFFKTLFSTLYRSESKATSAPLSETRTIGETYAMLKTHSQANNELAYQLVCDPAIEVPAIHRGISTDQSDMTASTGEKITVTGYITDRDGNADTGFNGEVVARLMEPARTVPCGKIESGEDPKTLCYTYADQQISMAAADVKSGRFSVEIAVPASASSFDGQDALVYLAAYDPSSRMGAADRHKLRLTAPQNGTSSETTDRIPPIVEQFAFDPTTCSVNLRVSDNYALNLSADPLFKGFLLYLDGKECPEASTSQPMLEKDRQAFSKNVVLHGLSRGQHAARIRVKDAAGNATEMEITFTYEGLRPAYSLRVTDSNPEGTTVIAIDGGTPENAVLVVMDAAGNEILARNFSGQTVEWDHTDTYGNRVAPGHYKAYVIERGKTASKGHSDTIDIPVV